MFDFGFRISDFGFSRDLIDRRRRVASRLHSFRNPHSEFRNGLTLIELLVVVFILTTLVVGVIPLISPNNDTRKIREASRGLQTYITLAQAEAARTGRAHGIAFRESAPGSGVALDVFQISVPPVFAGFSSNSRVSIATLPAVPPTYGPVSADNPNGNDGTYFAPFYTGYPLYNLSFELATSTSAAPLYDPFPPRMIRMGDRINVDGNIFMIVDDDDPASQPNQIDDLDGDNDVTVADEPLQYVVPDTTTTRTPTVGIWLNNSGQLLSQSFERYEFQRQPAGPSSISGSAEAPYQFPAGVAIDLQGSVVEGGATAGEPLFPGSFDDITDQIPPPPANPGYDTVSIMFTPSGAVSSITHNGLQVNNAARVVLLLGRVENGGLQFVWSGSEVTAGDWVLDPNRITPQEAQDELKQKQQTVNWLNLDSRWLSIASNTGRVTVSESAYVNATLVDYIGADDRETAVLQIEAAHTFAHEMRGGGGG